MHIHRRHTEAGVAFVRDEHQSTGFRRDEIRAGDDGLCLHVFFAQMIARAMGNGLRVVVVVVGDTFAQKCFGDVAAVFVDDGFDDVRGLIVIELDDQLGLCRKTRQSIPAAIRRGLERNPQVAFRLLDTHDLLRDT